MGNAVLLDFAAHAESLGRMGAKKSGQHRILSDNSGVFGATDRKDPPIEEPLQVHETRPTSEEAGLAENWHPLGIQTLLQYLEIKKLQIKILALPTLLSIHFVALFGRLKTLMNSRELFYTIESKSFLFSLSS